MATTTTTTEKRCYYEVMGLPRSCTQDEIRSAYKKLALQRHPDKLIQSGVSSADATAAFQELSRAYEVLSDPKERSWYDSHRSQILFSSSSSSNNTNNSDSPFPDLFSYFSPSCYTDYTHPKTGFYKVYADVFDKVYAYEINYCRTMGLSLGLVKEAPLLGDLNSDYTQVNAFYGYWLAFCTVLDFGWVDKWDAAAGVNRKSRRVMEDENKKLRRKAKKEFNETVRGLAEFVKKRDKRVIDMMVRKEKERQKRREEEVAKRKEREREKLEKARLYEEPEWAKVEEVELEDFEEEEDEEERKEFYCVACGKKFKSDKQWKNHEKSKKHKDKVAQLRKTFIEEDDYENVDGEVRGEDVAAEDVIDQNDPEGNGFVSAAEDDDDDDDDLEEKFKECVGLDEEKNLSDDKEGNGNIKEQNGFEPSSGGSDDESEILESMISGYQNKRHVTSKSDEKNNALSEDDVESMTYNNKKGKRKSRRAKKDKAKVSYPWDGSANDQVEENKGIKSPEVANNGDDDQEDDDTEATASTKAGKQSFKSKGNSKQDAESKLKNSSRGKKQKEKPKNRDPICEKCGEEFESRTKLHKHLNETGHATLKSR